MIGGHERSPVRALAGVAGLAVALVLVVAALRLGDDAGAVRSALLDEPAPQATLPRLEGGGEIDLAELRGKTVVLNFWASWCRPCRAEHPELARIAADYRDRDVEVLGVVFQDDEADAVAFLDRYGRGYDNVVDTGSRTAIDFGLFGVPETFFLDEDGVVRGNVGGAVDYEIVAETLDRMLADS